MLIAMQEKGSVTGCKVFSMSIDSVCVCDHKATLKLITKRPTKPTDEEVSVNPRSRSARLRAAERLPAEEN